MATIDSQEIIDALLAGDGIYPGDEAIVVRIVAFTNGSGDRTHGIVYASEAAQGLLYRYEEENRYVHDPVVIFQRYELAICEDCWPRLACPFSVAGERDVWASRHHRATGHVVTVRTEIRKS
jgi:hypothetical protein